MPDLSRKRERERLAIRHIPYFQRIGRDAFLGFRRGPDTWSARLRTRDGKQAHKFLGGHSNSMKPSVRRRPGSRNCRALLYAALNARPCERPWKRT